MISTPKGTREAKSRRSSTPRPPRSSSSAPEEAASQNQTVGFKKKKKEGREHTGKLNAATRKGFKRRRTKGKRRPGSRVRTKAASEQLSRLGRRQGREKELARGRGGQDGEGKRKRPREQKQVQDNKCSVGARRGTRRMAGGGKERSVAVCARPDPGGRPDPARGEAAGGRARGGRQAQILMRVPLARTRKKGKMRSWKEALKVWMWVMLSAL